MNFREAHAGDIQQIQMIRNSVKENLPSHPSLFTGKDWKEF